MFAVHGPDREARISCHSSMNSTMSKKSAVNVVRGNTWNSSDHIRRIYESNTNKSFMIKIGKDFNREEK